MIALLDSDVYISCPFTVIAINSELYVTLGDLETVFRMQ